MRYPDTLLQVFCKAPEPGRVKTRLAETLGDTGAAELHGAMVESAIEQATAAGLCPVELRTPDTAHPFFNAFALPLFPQPGTELGERMAGCLEQGLRTHGQVLLIGTDCPPLDADYLEAAVMRLANHDVVLGPAEDGGYGLVGVKGGVPDMFEGIDWGTGSVLDETCRHLNTRRINYALLPLIWDVDRPADLPRYEAWLAQQSGR